MPTKIPVIARLPTPFHPMRSFSSLSRTTLQPNTSGVMPSLSPKSGIRPQCFWRRDGFPSAGGRRSTIQFAHLRASAAYCRRSPGRLRFARCSIASLMRVSESMCASARWIPACSPDGAMNILMPNFSTRRLRSSQSISGALSILILMTLCPRLVSETMTCVMKASQSSTPWVATFMAYPKSEPESSHAWRQAVGGFAPVLPAICLT